jgi:hypothetical protein
MARIKGTNLAHIRDYVASQLGAGAIDRMRAVLGPETRQAFDSFIASAWYPDQAYVDLVHALRAAFGADHPEVLQKAGAYAAEFDITRIHRVLFRFANPAFVLEKSTEIWSRFFDSGAWTITRSTETSADGFLEGWTIVDAVSCDYLCAYLHRMFELVGAKNVVVRHPDCRARPHTHAQMHSHTPSKACRFVITWQ